MTTDFKTLPLIGNGNTQSFSGFVTPGGKGSLTVVFIRNCQRKVLNIQIDVSPLLEKWDDPSMAQDKGVADVVRQLGQACKEAGFFYVKGHGIPDSLVKEVRNIAHRYFDLPYEEKIKIKLSATTGYRGYQHVGENITKGVPDMHEAIDGSFFEISEGEGHAEAIRHHTYAASVNIYGDHNDIVNHILELYISQAKNMDGCYKEVKKGMYGALGETMQGSNIWPSHPPNFKKLMEEYVNLCTELSRKIMRGIALALGGSPVEFEGTRAGDPFWVLRIIGYPGVSPASGQDMPKNDIGCGAHTDYGLLTLVNQDVGITALQVKNVSGEWISAPPIPGTFVCNIGDMLKVLSNGLYESTLHRVINNSPIYRVCVAYFYEPNYDAVIEPLDACVKQTGGTTRFEGAVYGKHLVSKVLTNFIY